MAWEKVLGLAPALVDSGKKLWERVSSRRAPKTAPRPGSNAHSSTGDSVAAAEVRLHVLEQRVAELEEEAVSSFEVVRSITQQQSQLAEQHVELVQATDMLLSRTRVLLWIGIALAVAFVVLLVVVIAR